ncbi:Uncharacterised protein [Streptococcus pneumoniae]|nr:Uncharacterised protein [Streptococcus pneumoniae]
MLVNHWPLAIQLDPNAHDEKDGRGQNQYNQGQNPVQTTLENQRTLPFRDKLVVRLNLA